MEDAFKISNLGHQKVHADTASMDAATLTRPEDLTAEINKVVQAISQTDVFKTLADDYKIVEKGSRRNIDIQVLYHEFDDSRENHGEVVVTDKDSHEEFHLFSSAAKGIAEEGIAQFEQLAADAASIAKRAIHVPPPTPPGDEEGAAAPKRRLRARIIPTPPPAEPGQPLQLLPPPAGGYDLPPNFPQERRREGDDILPLLLAFAIGRAGMMGVPPAMRPADAPMRAPQAPIMGPAVRAPQAPAMRPVEAPPRAHLAGQVPPLRDVLRPDPLLERMIRHDLEQRAAQQEARDGALVPFGGLPEGPALERFPAERMDAAPYAGIAAGGFEPPQEGGPEAVEHVYMYEDEFAQAWDEHVAPHFFGAGGAPRLEEQVEFVENFYEEQMRRFLHIHIHPREGGLPAGEPVPLGADPVGVDEPAGLHGDVPPLLPQGHDAQPNPQPLAGDVALPQGRFALPAALPHGRFVEPAELPAGPQAPPFFDVRDALRPNPLMRALARGEFDRLAAQGQARDARAVALVPFAADEAELPAGEGPVGVDEPAGLHGDVPPLLPQGHDAQPNPQPLAGDVALPQGRFALPAALPHGRFVEPAALPAGPQAPPLFDVRDALRPNPLMRALARGELDRHAAQQQARDARAVALVPFAADEPEVGAGVRQLAQEHREGMDRLHMPAAPAVEEEAEDAAGVEEAVRCADRVFGSPYAAAFGDAYQAIAGPENEHPCPGSSSYVWGLTCEQLDVSARHLLPDSAPLAQRHQATQGMSRAMNAARDTGLVGTPVVCDFDMPRFTAGARATNAHFLEAGTPAASSWPFPGAAAEQPFLVAPAVRTSHDDVSSALAAVAVTGFLFLARRILRGLGRGGQRRGGIPGPARFDAAPPQPRRRQDAQAEIARLEREGELRIQEEKAARRAQRAERRAQDVARRRQTRGKGRR